MLDRYSILIVEDDGVVAMNLAAAVEASACDVVGPAATVAAAMASLGACSIDAAVLNAHLADRDVTPVAPELIDRAIRSSSIPAPACPTRWRRPFRMYR